MTERFQKGANVWILGDGVGWNLIGPSKVKSGEIGQNIMISWLYRPDHKKGHRKTCAGGESEMVASRSSDRTKGIFLSIESKQSQLEAMGGK